MILSKTSFFIFISTIVFIFACTPTKVLTPTKDDNIIEFIFIQVNDVYEIAPLQGGKVGGLARVATLRKKLLLENKNTFLVHAGDFVNPSVIGTLKYEGQSIKGKHMVEVMNATGFDLVTFGNHEFDIKEDELQSRLNESNFEWTSCNTFQTCGDRLYPFYRMVKGRKHFAPETYVWEIEDNDGTKLNVGIFGVTIPLAEKDFVHYDDIFTSSKTAVQELSRSTDIVIGLTHLLIKQDKEVATQNPEIALIMGGHDHNNMKYMVGNTTIAKADANAKTVYVHRIKYDKKTKTNIVNSELISIDETIEEDPAVDLIVQKWSIILDEQIKDIVDEPNKVIYNAVKPLNGIDSDMRSSQTNLGEVATKAMFESINGVDASFINSGSFRIDDDIIGEITAVDVFRVLPFGGKVLKVEMTGKLLKEVLEESESNIGNGGYLQVYNIQKQANKWLINNSYLDTNRIYNIALNDFMLSGYEYKSFTKENPGISTILEPSNRDTARDIRLAIIKYFEKL